MGCWADEFTSLRLDFFLFYFWLCLFIAILGLFSSCGEWGLFSSCSAWAAHSGGFSCCQAWAVGLEGLVAPQHVESSWGRDLEGKILTLGLPRQVLYLNFLISAML